MQQASDKPHKSRSRRVGEKFLRPFACTVPHCHKAFTRVEHLRRHQLNHQSTHKWNCPSCPATFVRLDLWRRHCRLSHEDILHALRSNAQQPGLDFLNPSFRGSPGRPRKNTVSNLSTQHDSDGKLSAKRPSNSLSETASVSPVCPIQCEHEATEIIELDVKTLSANGRAAESLQGPSPTQSQHSNHSDCAQSSPLPELRDGTEKVPYGSQCSAEQDVDWTFGLDLRYASFTTATDLAWLFDGALLNPLDDDISQVIDDNNMGVFGGDVSTSFTDDLHGPPSPGSPGLSFTPVREADPQAPTCGFRICNALTEPRRIELLRCLQNDMPDIDIDSPIFTLNNMKMGVHLYAREVSKEVPIFHHQFFVPSTEEERQDLEKFCGGEAPYQLSWAIITLGWVLWDFHEGRDIQMAMRIQKVLRQSVINHRAFTLDPPIWIVQTLFFVLLFARYKGSNEDHGAATIFHGVLIDAVRRLDLRGRSHYVPDLDSGRPLRHEWFKWIHVETLKRLVFHTFILDVQHTILHGGDMSMSPFELHLQLPYSEDAWCSDNVTEWVTAIRKKSKPPVLFLTMLKQFWNSSYSTHRLPQACPGDSKVVLYGIMSIACDMRRRDDNTFSARPKDSLSSLNAKVLKSFESWVMWWDRYRAPMDLEIYLWRNCTCMLRLAYTLYEIGPVELQAAAGRDNVEGKRIGTADYARAKRKIRAWAKEERSMLAVTKAASIIHDRLSPSYVPRSHCSYCNWALYLAGLVCWNFSFAITGGSGQLSQPANAGAHTADIARAHCEDYVCALLAQQDSGVRGKEGSGRIERPTGMLVTLIGILEQDGSGLISESVESMKRLVGSKVNSTVEEFL